MIVAVSVGLVGAAAPAAAHATVVSSSPADGAALEASPQTLTFDLSEAVSLVEGSTQLIDADGSRHPLAAPRLENGHQRILLDVAEQLPDGAYLATARVVSADTHVVSLSIRFTVGDARAQGDWGTLDSGGAVVDRAVLLPVKAVSYLGLVLSAGMFLAARWAWPDVTGTNRFRVVYQLGVALLGVGLIGRFVVLVAEQAGGLGGVSWSSITTIAATPFGIALLISVICGVPAALSAGGAPQIAHAVAAITAVALGGHGAATELWPLPLVATFAHVYAIAVWLGGLAVIVAVTKGVAPLSRWHRVAAGHVGLAVLAGVILGLLQVRPVNALLTTPYGVTLLVKVVLVAATVVAGYAAYRVLRAGSGTGRRTVWTEAVATLAVIAVTSSLSSLTPAKDSYTTTVATRLDFGDSDIVDVDINTVRRGAQMVTIKLPGTSDAEVSVELSSATANVARLPVQLTPAPTQHGVATWRSERLIVPSAGQWKVTVRFDDGGSPKLASFYYEVL